MSFKNIAIVGVGLIGGAVGLAARRKLKLPVRGSFRDRAELETAKRIGAVDDGCLTPREAVAGCDLVILATAVDQLGEIAREIAPHLDSGATLIDTGSTKVKVVQEVEAALQKRTDVSFVGCHPLAGSERSGVTHASTVELQEATCVLTPTPGTPRETVDRVAAFWEGLGMYTIEARPEDHDVALARVSHVPHFVAAALVLLPTPVETEFAAQGFLDSTRLAAGSPEIWTAIAGHNSRQVADTLGVLIGHLHSLQEMIQHGNAKALRTFLEEARRARKDLDRPSRRAKVRKQDNDPRKG